MMGHSLHAESQGGRRGEKDFGNEDSDQKKSNILFRVL